MLEENEDSLNEKSSTLLDHAGSAVIRIESESLLKKDIISFVNMVETMFQIFVLIQFDDSDILVNLKLPGVKNRVQNKKYQECLKIIIKCKVIKVL